jgi:hypothetical protein
MPEGADREGGVNHQKGEEMSKQKRITLDLEFFYAGGSAGSNCGIPSRHTCGICGARFYDFSLPVNLEGETTEGPWVGDLCGECLTSSPKRLAELARERAPILRVKRPRSGDDADTNVQWADDLLRAADMLESLGRIDDLPGGTLARKIGEGYREMEASRPQRTRKAA